LFNFIIQILIAVFFGACFVFLAKRYEKSQFIYFCVGFFTCLGVGVFYLFVYGFITNFKVNIEFNYHRKLSIVLSLIISYILFRIIKKRLREKKSEYSDINDIGKQ